MALAGSVQPVVLLRCTEVFMWDQIKQALTQSTTRFLTRFADLLPGMAALIVALLFSIILGCILAIIVRRLLGRIHFDQRAARWGFPTLEEGSPMHSPTLLLSQALAGLIIIGGFLIGMTAFDAEWTSLFAQSVLGYMPNVLSAALVLLVGTIIARFLARSVLIGAVNLNLQYARLLSVGVKWLGTVLAVTIAIERLGFGGGIIRLAFGILFGGIVLALALAVGLGSKDLVSRSLERETSKASTPNMKEPVGHL